MIADKIGAGAIASVFLLAGCQGLNLEPRPEHAVLSVTPSEIKVQQNGGNYTAAIPFVYVNTTPNPVFVSSCGDQSQLLEKKLDGKWIVAWAPMRLMCRVIPDYSIASGGSASGVFRLSTSTSTEGRFHEWYGGSIEGTYRLRWDFVGGTDAGAPGARRINTVSNEFKIILSYDRLSFASQLVIVTTPGWDSTAGELHRFYRDNPYSSWREDGRAIPIVVGKTGLAWGVGFDSAAIVGEPHKHEGDGKSPAGIFPIDTAFGFAPVDSMRSLHLPYAALTSNSECVDDTASVHYNTVVERNNVPSVDWESSENMRNISQYRLGAIIGYNEAPPVKARGSCIFFHIWNGPRSTTVGCTAMDGAELERLLLWLDRRKHPMVVQLPASAYPRIRNEFDLPFLGR